MGHSDKSSGIYKITCIPTGKIYIGSAVNLQKRWYEHRYSLRKNTHCNCYLQAAYNKYGESVFVFSILETCEIDALLEYEQYYLDTLQPYREKGFNISHESSSTRGRILSLESREKCRAANLGRTHSQETREKLRKANLGKRHTPEARAKIGAANKGKHSKKRTPEQRAKMSKAQKGLSRRPHSAESRAKLSAIKMGKPLSPKGLEAARNRPPRFMYTLTSPKGEIIQTSNLNQFCKEHGLGQSAMSRVSRGECSHHKNWKITRIPLR